jgi:hypothetical protein
MPLLRGGCGEGGNKLYEFYYSGIVVGGGGGLPPRQGHSGRKFERLVPFLGGKNNSVWILEG